MPKFVRLTVPTGETVWLNANTVVNVHAVFRGEAWPDDANTVVLYGNGLKVAVTEDVQFVVDQLNDRLSK